MALDIPYIDAVPVDPFPQLAQFGAGKITAKVSYTDQPTQSQVDIPGVILLDKNGANGNIFLGHVIIDSGVITGADIIDRVGRLLGHVTVDSVPTTAVTGTFWQATQPVSNASLPLPTGASTETTLGLIKAKTDNLDVLLSTRTKPADTQPVSLATNTPDVTDRAARLLGHVTVDTAPTTAVTGTFWQSTQPVSLATNSPDVTDRAARLLGHVTVDTAPTTAVTGTFWQSTQPVSQAANVADLTASGTITTQNLVPAGAATAGSAVSLVLRAGQDVLGIQVTGVYTGALSVQATLDDATWVTLAGVPVLLNTGISAGTVAATIVSAATGLFQVNVSGYSQVRVTGLAAVTGTATVSLRSAVSKSQFALGAPIPTGSNVIGNIGTLTTITAGANLIADVGVQYRASATGGSTVGKIVSAASTNATNLKASAGRLIGWALTGTTAAIKYLHIHNLAGAPTVGTSVPMFTIAVPASGTVAIQLPGGIAMATGIAYSITNLAADLDATAVALGDVIGALFYA